MTLQAIDDRSSWSIERLGEAMTRLAVAADLPVRQAETGGLGGPSPVVVHDRETLSSWVETGARLLRLEASPLRVPLCDVGNALAEAAPALVLVGPDEGPRVVALLSWHGRNVTLLGSDGRRQRIPSSALLDAIGDVVDPGATARVDHLLARAAIAPSRRPRAHRSMLDRVLGGRLVDVGWSLALPPSAPFSSQLRSAGVWTSICTILLMHVTKQALGAAGWWLIARGALRGQMEQGWLLAWGLAALSTIPPDMVGSWTRATAALRVGILLKRRLLYGALRLEPDEVRHQGSGELLGRVIESNALESLVTTGGLVSLVAVTEVALAAAVLCLPPTGWVAASAFGAFVGLLFVLAASANRRMIEWTRTRLDMTRDLIERMVGHRTRVVQEPRERWHGSEDEALEKYAERSMALDRIVAWLQGALPRAWLIVGIAAFAPGFASGAMNGADLALAIGGILIGRSAIEHVTLGLTSLLRARVAWQEVRPLFRAGGREESPGVPDWAVTGRVDGPEIVLEARDIHFRYRGRAQPVLRGVSLSIARCDRVLLEGPSGGGKSTLAAILTGLREAESGLVLLGGMDRQTLGDTGWRRRAIAAPQFHENHLIGAPLAFNMLMGRRWPPHERDLADAREVCVELGLGPLLERMPAGIMQMVGETGWQLSHGERSRVFVARALLQKSDLLVLDESFASLDPETLERALRCVLRRSPALLVIAHP